jgi:hypothetical protein
MICLLFHPTFLLSLCPHCTHSCTAVCIALLCLVMCAVCCVLCAAILIFCWLGITCCRIYSSLFPSKPLPVWALCGGHAILNTQGFLNGVVFCSVRRRPPAVTVSKHTIIYWIIHCRVCMQCVVCVPLLLLFISYHRCNRYCSIEVCG